MKLLLLLTIFAPACNRARAGMTDPPSKMEPIKAAQLDAALAHLRELSEQERPYVQLVQSICSEYKINPQDIGRKVGVNFLTGEITRQKEAK